MHAQGASLAFNRALSGNKVLRSSRRQPSCSSAHSALRRLLQAYFASQHQAAQPDITVILAMFPARSARATSDLVEGVLGDSPTPWTPAPLAPPDSSPVLEWAFFPCSVLITAGPRRFLQLIAQLCTKRSCMFAVSHASSQGCSRGWAAAAFRVTHQSASHSCGMMSVIDAFYQLR